MLFTTLTLLGCGSQRTTKIFKWTPINSIDDDYPTTPQRLTKELEEELKLEDTKRIKMLQEKEQEKKEKEGKPAGKRWRKRRVERRK